MRKPVAREAGRKSAIAKGAGDAAIAKAARDTAVAKASREAAVAKAAIRGATRQAGGIAGEPAFTALGLIRPARNGVLLVDTVLRRSRLALRAAWSMGEGMLRFGCMLERALCRSGDAGRSRVCVAPEIGGERPCRRGPLGRGRPAALERLPVAGDAQANENGGCDETEICGQPLATASIDAL